MGDTLRRERGEKYPNGIVKREIVRFLLLSDGGCASEDGIRTHLFECFQVSDRSTIRNQHLGYLKTKGIIDVKREPGKENFWFVVNDPSIVDYIFTEFQGDELVEIYRGNFVQANARNWYARLASPSEDGVGPVDMEFAVGLRHPPTWERYYLARKWLPIEFDAVKVSPSHFYIGDPASPERIVIGTLLADGGRDVDNGIPMRPNDSPCVGFGYMIADLLVDFRRYESLQGDILAFMKRTDVLQMFVTLFPITVVKMVFRCMSGLHRPPIGATREDMKQLYDFELPDPLTAPPAPPDWEKELLMPAAAFYGVEEF